MAGNIDASALVHKVTFECAPYRRLKPNYQLIADFIAGSKTVKDQGAEYLPIPIAEVDPKLQTARYTSYVQRATFYAVTQRTLMGLLGQVFLRAPVFNVTPDLEPVLLDMNAEGLDKNATARAQMAQIVGFGRSGIHVDYTATDRPTTAKDVEDGTQRPLLKVVDAINIINWQMRRVEGKRILTLLVYAEVVNRDAELSGNNEYLFGSTEQLEYVELRLLRSQDGRRYCIQRRWHQDEPKPYATAVIRLASGEPIDYVPFFFGGSENNDADPDVPPLYGIATLNLGHYRNSADYEESVFLTGQPTLVLVGLTESWLNDTLKGTAQFGSRGGIPLPVGGSAQLLQAEPNQLAFEAMAHKERLMVSLGASIIAQREVQRTASEATTDTIAANSALGIMAQNGSAAMRDALRCAHTMVSTDALDDDAIRVEYNTDYEVSTMSPEMRRQVVSEWLQNAITYEEMRAGLRKSGVATESDDEAKTKLDAQQAERDKQQMELMKAQVAARGGPSVGSRTTLPSAAKGGNKAPTSAKGVPRK
jgi:hypothetical protein